jgi:uncharacterized protein YjbI with pentapeptide repeats
MDAVAATEQFFDDFSDPELSRYYEITAGVGRIVRRPDGLHYDISRAPDGPSDSSDYLTIDYLGRPHSPAARAAVRFSGTRWTLDACVEYDFPTGRNGRQASLWLVHGDAGDRYRESVVLVRDADLDRNSLSLVVHDPQDESVASSLVPIASRRAERYWLRVERIGSLLTASWSDDGSVFTEVLRRPVRSASDAHCLVLNGASFAGGASFVLRSFKLAGARPDPAPRRPAVLALEGREVSSADILGAVQAGRDVDLRSCAIRGSLALEGVTVASAMSFIACRLDEVGLSNVDFTGPLRMVGCAFTADARFIDTRFGAGANFSWSEFSEKPFFRMIRTSRPVSFYHATFRNGADLSGSTFDDLSVSDVAVHDGSVTLHGSRVTGTVGLMVTLQREPQPMGREWDLSSADIERLVVSAGDWRDPNHTGPALWNLAPNLFLRGATVGDLEFHNVHLSGALDLQGLRLGSRLLSNSTFTNVIGGWPVQTPYYTCFLSYSTSDAEFARRLYAELGLLGVDCWFDEEHLGTGQELRQRVYDAILQRDKLLLVLSEHSIASNWVKFEVEACFELEDQHKREVLFPIRLDDAIMTSGKGWAAGVRQKRIGDFSQWQDPEAYHGAFLRLLRDLRPT